MSGVGDIGCDQAICDRDKDGPLDGVINPLSSSFKIHGILSLLWIGDASVNGCWTWHEKVLVHVRSKGFIAEVMVAAVTNSSQDKPIGIGFVGSCLVTDNVAARATEDLTGVLRRICFLDRSGSRHATDIKVQRLLCVGGFRAALATSGDRC